MQLLVSVRDTHEARTALAGGADVVDAKDPLRGALGRVSGRRLAAISAAVGRARPLSAALGDATDERAIARAASAAVLAGVRFVKIGFAGVASEARARTLTRAAKGGTYERAGARAGAGAALVLVAYADWRKVDSLAPSRVVAVAAACGAAGVLLDTACKTVPLFALEPPALVAAWVAAAHAAGLFAALAGGLSGSDFPTVRALGADLVGVRGAACVGGRTGRVVATRVAALRASAGPATRVPVGWRVFAQGDVELPEVVRGHHEMLSARRERA